MEVRAPAVQPLVEQVRRLSPPVEQPAETADGNQGHQVLADGYCRLSPVQAYVSPRGGRRRLLTALAAAGAAAAGIALLFLVGYFVVFRHFRVRLPWA